MWPLRRRFYFSAEQKRNQLPRRESRIRTTFHFTPGSKMKRISRGPAECSKRSPNQINHGCPRNRGVRVQDQRTSTGRHATSLSRRASLCVKAYRNIPEEERDLHHSMGNRFKSPKIVLSAPQCAPPSPPGREGARPIWGAPLCKFVQISPRKGRASLQIC